MRIQTLLKRIASNAVLPLACMGVMAYFGWHGVYGEYGVFQAARLEERLNARKAEFDQIAAERAKLEKRVDLLRPGHVDPDMLDEQARLTLGFTGPDEITIFWARAEGPQG